MKKKYIYFGFVSIIVLCFNLFAWFNVYIPFKNDAKMHINENRIKVVEAINSIPFNELHSGTKNKISFLVNEDYDNPNIKSVIANSDDTLMFDVENQNNFSNVKKFLMSQDGIDSKFYPMDLCVVYLFIGISFGISFLFFVFSSFVNKVFREKIK